MIKKYEFWNPRVFELPYYLYLAWLCLVKRVAISSLAKANYALDHGDIGIGSKLDSQMAFKQDRFLPSIRIADKLATADKKKLINDFIKQHGYPAVLKSDVGCVGKGICKISSAADIDKKTPLLLGDFILQKYTPLSFECGVFYIRQNKQPRISGINKKHFPTVTGNGVDDLAALAQSHQRYTAHWQAFLQDFDTTEILAENEQRRLSFIGSHTLGCKFTDDTDLLTPELEQAIFALFDNQPGFNFGRIDVKATDEAALGRGEFVVIEVNGIASLPTHMFDPKYSLYQAYKVFFQHGKYLVEIAKEHKKKSMNLMSYAQVIQRVKENQQMLNRVHQRLMNN